MESNRNVLLESREALRKDNRPQRGAPRSHSSADQQIPSAEHLDRYFSGEALIGDDFTAEEIAQWFADEKEACFEIRGGMKKYPYHAKNWFYGYRRLRRRQFRNVLCFGGGNGVELLPIADRLGNVTILEPSSNFKAVINARYVTPNVDGSMSFPDNTFDLVTCFGVLHHIPNVSRIVEELYRCTAGGGVVLLTEPINSMGDWTKPRPGLTKRERGIPIHLLRLFIKNTGFEIVSESKCSFGPINYVSRKLHLTPYNSRFIVMIDNVVCKLPFWSTDYRATTVLKRIRPASVFYVLRK